MGKLHGNNWQCKGKNPESKEELQQQKSVKVSIKYWDSTTQESPQESIRKVSRKYIKVIGKYN